MDYGNKLVLKLNLTNAILTNNQLDWLNKFKTTKNKIESFHIHINTNIFNNFGELIVGIYNPVTGSLKGNYSINHIYFNWTNDNDYVGYLNTNVSVLKLYYGNYQTLHKQQKLANMVNSVSPFLGSKL